MTEHELEQLVRRWMTTPATTAEALRIVEEVNRLNKVLDLYDRALCRYADAEEIDRLTDIREGKYGISVSTDSGTRETQE